MWCSGYRPDNRLGSTSLHIAASRGFDDVVDALLQLGAFPEPLNAAQETPLALAARNGFPSVAIQLLDKGVDVNQLDGLGWTPLYHATAFCHGVMVELLLSRDADPLIRAYNG